MIPSHRIEIVIEEPWAPELIRVLKQLHVPGYTVIPRAGGSGDRGIRRGDELAGVEGDGDLVTDGEALDVGLADGEPDLLALA